MTFDELKLACAVTRARIRFGSGDVFRQARKMALVRSVFDEWLTMFDDCYFPFNADKVADIYMAIRKRGKGVTAADIALAHGQYRCFWVGRGKGDCSDDVDAGHINPASSGHELTIANGIIECSRHNRSRGVQTIEEYLARPAP